MNTTTLPPPIADGPLTPLDYADLLDAAEHVYMGALALGMGDAIRASSPTLIQAAGCLLGDDDPAVDQFAVLLEMEALARVPGAGDALIQGMLLQTSP